MSTRIFWFSGTGNSLAVARRLATASAGTCAPITTAGAASLSGCDHLILVFPVYAWGMPAIVDHFIASLPSGGAPRATVVVTHGGMPGPAAALAAASLKQRGTPLVATHAVRMVDNFPPFGGPPKPEACEKRLAKAEAQLAKICAAATDATAASKGKNHSLTRPVGGLLNALFRRWITRGFRKFHATDACTGCGLCQRICPVATIELVAGRPLWHGRCEGCFACFHWCPERAVAFGRIGPRRGRYHHPDVKANDLVGRA